MRVLYCGRILTIAEPLYAESMLVEDGYIVDVGNRNELSKRYPDADLVEFSGVMMPAFIDAHSHFSMNAGYMAQCDVRGAKSLAEVACRVRAYIDKKHIAPGEWIIANNYDHTVFDDVEPPKLSEIDAICPNNPLVLRHRSAHMIVANSAALNIGAVTEADADSSPNFEIKDGKLTGCLKEGAAQRVTKHIPPQSVNQLFDAVTETCRFYTSRGITTVQDGGIGQRSLDLYKLINGVGELDVDIVAYISGSANYAPLKESFDSFNRMENFSVGGIKAFLDGSPQLRTAWVRKPYLTEDTCYRQSVSDDKLINAFCTAAKHNTQILVHCNGDAAIEQFLRCLEVAEKDHPSLKELKPVIIHAQLMGRDQLPKAKELGAVVSFFVAHCYHWGDVHLENFGEERGMRISPVGSAIELGVDYTFHQDAPVILPDMLETVWCAVNRITRNGVKLAEDERISVLDALKGVTVNAARQYSCENLKGTIEKGKYADLVLLDKDPLVVDPMDIRSIKVKKTYRRGICVYSAE